MIGGRRLRSALACAALVAVAGCAKKQKPQEPPPVVEVARPLTAEVRDWDEAVGRFLSIQAVDVRPRARPARRERRSG